MRFSKSHIFLVVTLLALIGLAIRVYPQLAYHLMPGSWEVYFAHPFWHLGTTAYHLSQITELHTYGYTVGVSGGPMIDQGYYIFNAMLVKVLGLSETQYLLWLRYFLFIPLVVWPLCIFSIYSYLCRQNRQEKHNVHLILLCAYALFGNYAIISNTSFTTIAQYMASNWSLMILAIYCLIRSRLDLRFGGLFLVLCACIASFYNTTAGFFLATLLIGVVAVVVVPKLHKPHAALRTTRGVERPRRAYLFYVILGIAITVGWYVMANKEAVSGVIKLLQIWLSPAVVAAGVESAAVGLGSLALVPYLLKDSIAILGLKAGAILASASPVLYLLFLLFTRRLKNIDVGTKAMTVAVVVLILALVPTIGYLFLFLGPVTALSRVNEFLPIIAAVSLAIVLACFRKSVAVRYILIFLIVAMCSSPYLALRESYTPANKLTYPEYHAIAWLSAASAKEDVIYTDGRMGTTFAMFDHFKVTGASTSEGDHPPYTSIVNLEAVYYSGDADDALKSICETKLDGESPRYMLFSKRDTEPKTGIHGLRLRFKPAPEGFLDKFTSLTALDLVYNDNTATIFRMNALNGACDR